MEDWRTFLDPDTRTHVASLVLIGCQFTWREEVTPGARSRPERIWFELWKHGRLLDVSGPFPQPVGRETLARVKELIMQWDRLLTLTQQY